MDRTQRLSSQIEFRKPPIEGLSAWMSYPEEGFADGWKVYTRDKKASVIPDLHKLGISPDMIQKEIEPYFKREWGEILLVINTNKERLLKSIDEMDKIGPAEESLMMRDSNGYYHILFFTY